MPFNIEFPKERVCRRCASLLEEASREGKEISFRKEIKQLLPTPILKYRTIRPQEWTNLVHEQCATDLQQLDIGQAKMQFLSQIAARLVPLNFPLLRLSSRSAGNVSAVRHDDFSRSGCFLLSRRKLENVSARLLLVRRSAYVAVIVSDRRVETWRFLSRLDEPRKCSSLTTISSDDGSFSSKETISTINYSELIAVRREQKTLELQAEQNTIRCQIERVNKSNDDVSLPLASFLRLRPRTSLHFFVDICISRRHSLVFLFPRRSNKFYVDIDLLRDRQISKNNQIRRRHLIEEEKKTEQRLSPRKATSSHRFRQISTRVDYIFDVFQAMRISLLCLTLIISSPIDLFPTRAYHDGSLHRLINHSLKLFFSSSKAERKSSLDFSLSRWKLSAHDDECLPRPRTHRTVNLAEERS